MGDTTTRLLEERIEGLEALADSYRAQIVALVWEIGKGKRVTISRGNQRHADQGITHLEVQRLKSTGEIRFTPHREEEPRG